MLAGMSPIDSWVSQLPEALYIIRYSMVAPESLSRRPEPHCTRDCTLCIIIILGSPHLGPGCSFALWLLPGEPRKLPASLHSCFLHCRCWTGSRDRCFHYQGRTLCGIIYGTTLTCMVSPEGVHDVGQARAVQAEPFWPPVPQGSGAIRQPEQSRASLVSGFCPSLGSRSHYPWPLPGPFWICTTLVFTLAISGNLSNFLEKHGNTSFRYSPQFHKGEG